MLLFPQFNCLAYLQTTGDLHYSVAYLHMFESVLSVGVFFSSCSSDDEWSVFALRDLYLLDTVYHIKIKQTTNTLSTLPGIVPKGPYIMLF